LSSATFAERHIARRGRRHQNHTGRSVAVLHHSRRPLLSGQLNQKTLRKTQRTLTEHGPTAAPSSSRVSSGPPTSSKKPPSSLSPSNGRDRGTHHIARAVTVLPAASLNPNRLIEAVVLFPPRRHP